MKASLQEQIAPRGRNATSEPSAGAMATKKQLNPESKVDFRDVLLNSNEEQARTRQAQKNGGLADSKSYDDFLKNLSKATESTRVPKNNLEKDDFLTLFVTQLQNQDPLNPKDGAEMASQLAQFNSLEQMLNVNKTLKSLEDKTQAKNDQSFINFLGREAFVADGRVEIKGGKVGEATFNLDFPVGKTTLLVKDAGGQTVAEANLGPSEAGAHKLEWDALGKDGKPLADGIYSMSLEGEGKDNSKIPIGLQTKITIEGLDLKDQSKGLYTSLGKMSFQDLVKVGNAGFNNYLKQKPVLAPKKESASAPAVEQEITPEEDGVKNEASQNGFEKQTLPTGSKLEPDSLAQGQVQQPILAPFTSLESDAAL